MSFDLKNMNDDGSKNEILFKRYLDFLGIESTYEPFTNDIIKSLQGTTGLYRPTQYTPDFLFEYKGEKIVIEVKGFARARDHLINKIADAYYTSRGYKYFVVTTAGTKAKGNRNYYLYKSKGQAKRGVRTKTFWEIIGIDKTEEELNEIWNFIDAKFRKEQNEIRAAERLANAKKLLEREKKVNNVYK